MTTDATPERRGFGVDVGGSGIKGGIVDLDTGQLIGDRFKLPTPQPATPPAVAKTIAEVVNGFGWTGRLGVTYPGVVTNGIVRTAANVDSAWIGTNAGEIIGAKLNGQQVTVLNDADAAGLAEERYGAGKDKSGLVVMLDLRNRDRVRGHLQRDTDSQHGAWPPRGRRQGSRAARRLVGQGQEQHELRKVGHGGDKGAGGHRERALARLVHRRRRHQPQGRQMGPLLESRTPVVPAALLNTAGIVGAAMAASADVTH